MPPSTPDPHQHDLMAVPPGFQDPAGRGVDYGLLWRFVGAVFDYCDICAETLLVLLGEDAVTTARLVELAMLSARRGGEIPTWAQLTGSVADEAMSDEFRELVLYGSRGGRAMFARCASMTAAQRRAAATTATVVLTRHLASGSS